MKMCQNIQNFDCQVLTNSFMNVKLTMMASIELHYHIDLNINSKLTSQTFPLAKVDIHQIVFRSQPLI